MDRPTDRLVLQDVRRDVPCGREQVGVALEVPHPGRVAAAVDAGDARRPADGADLREGREEGTRVDVGELVGWWKEGRRFPISDEGRCRLGGRGRGGLWR